MFASAFEFIGVLGPDGTLLEANDSALAFVGASRDEVIGRPFWDTPWWRSSPEGQRRLREAVHEAAQGARVRFEAEHLDRDGVPAWVDFSLSPSLDASGAVAYLIPEGRDITDVRRAHRAVLDSEAQLAALFDRAPFGAALSTSPEGATVRVNDELLRLLGFTRDEVLGKTSVELGIADAESREALAERLRTHGAVRDAPVTRRTKSGETLDLLLNLDRLSLADGDFVLTTVQDITARKREQDRQAFLLKLSDALRPLEDPASIKTTANRLLGLHLGVDRVVYEEHVEKDGRAYWLVENIYHVSAYPLTAGLYPIEGFGRDSYVVLQGKPAIVNDVANDPGISPEAKEIFRAVDVAAYVALPVVTAGRRIASFVLNQGTPRAWKPHEVSLLQETAERTSAMVERARAKEALRDSEQRFATLASLSPVGILRTDLEGRVTYVNDRVTALTGLTLEQSRGTGWTQCIHPDDRADVQQTLQRAIESRQVGQAEFRCVHPDGHVSWLLGQSGPDTNASGETVGIIGTLTDITAAKQANEALSNDQEQALLQTAAQGILSVDAHGIVTLANPAAHVMFGFDPGALVGQPIDRLLPADARARHAAHRARYLEAPKPRPMGRGLELVAQRVDGSTFPVEISLNQVAGPNGARTVAFVSDITERLRAAAALHARTAELERQAQQLRRLASDLTLAEQRTRSDLAKTVHDGLQQLLFSASLKMSRAIATLGDEPLLLRARTELQEAIAATRSLSVELSPPALRDGGLPVALEWLATWVREKYDVELQLSLDPRADPEEEGVRVLLFQSVRELAFNAIKHAEVERIRVSLALIGTDLRISVADDGPGFDVAAALGHATDTPRLGLLSIRERLTLLGGQMTIDAAPGEGARFTLTVPHGPGAGVTSASSEHDPTRAGGHAAGSPGRAAGGPLRILVVDDHAVVRDGLRELLAGYAELVVVGEAADGAQAIEQARALQPDVVLMDVSMPVLDGVEATRRLRAEMPHVHVFGLSTQEQLDRLHAIEEAGATAYFTKDERAHRVVARLLAEHAARSGLDSEKT